ncbi:MAG: DUF6261 family protein [Prevotellaceae bacterium]|nr:DUF6261 family protein [Prevotellaceae bacterium]
MIIESMGMSKMPNGGHYSYVENQIKHLTDNKNVSSKLPPLLAELQKKFDVEAQKLVTFRTNPLTEAVAAADKKCDTLYRGIVAYVRGFRNYPLADNVAAAKDVELLLHEYNINISSQVNKELGLMENLIDDMRNKYPKQVLLLGLTDYVNALDAATKELKAAMDERLTQQSSVVVGALKAARKETDAALKQIFTVLNALIVIDGEDKYRKLALLLNAETTHAKRQMLGQHAQGNTDESGDTGSDNGDDDVPQG